MNTQLELEITDVAHGGVFIARHEGRVVFVSDAIPGERVLARVSDDKKSSFWRAETVSVLDASPHRQPHMWAQAGLETEPGARPGGAEFGHIKPAFQRELKAKVLGDALARFGKLTDTNVQVQGPFEPADAAGRRWRTRVSLHVNGDGLIGPFAARSHRVIPVTEHPLATSGIEQVALEVVPGDGDTIDIVQSGDGRVHVMHRKSDDRKRKPQGVITETAGGREFQVDLDGFWQVHAGAADVLTGAVQRAISGVEIDGDAWHLDLYGGVGLFAAAIADKGATRVTSVEFDARATEHAGENLSEWIGARAETARVDRFTRDILTNASATERERLQRGVVVLDPPRAGAGANVTKALAEIAPRAIVYVACDPVALSRDLGTFAEQGYTARSIEAFDLFPNSHHLEAVALLQRD